MALPAPSSRSPGGLVASAADLTRLAADSPETYGGRRSLPWQKRALAYIDLIPELAYSSKFYARMLKQLQIYPATKTSTGKPQRIDGGPPVEALDRIRDKSGGMGQILGNYGRLMFTTGEGTLLALNLETEDEYWQFVWNDEVKIEYEGKPQRIKKILHQPVPGKPAIEYGPTQAEAYRLWTPHPRASGEADSPMRSSLDIAEELLILTSAVRSTAVSRILNGILVMPIEIAPPPQEAKGDENPENDPFISEFTEHIEAQVENAGSAAAAAPYIVWAAHDYLDRVKWMQLHDPQTDYMEEKLRSEAVERLARGFDFPPEVLKGLGDTNHWAARQILDDMWRSHGAPVAQQFCDDINDAYLRRTLREEGFEGWHDVVICYDESEVVVKPDRSEDADSAAKYGYISAVGYRKLKNIPEEYKPSKAEHDEWLAIQLRQPAIAGLESSTPAPGPAPAAPPAGQRDPSQGPPPPGPEGDSGRRTRVTTSAERDLGAVSMAVARCRELAGIRLRKREKHCPECFEKANGQPNARVASLVGAEILQHLSVTAEALVHGGADTLKGVLTEWGYSATQAKTTAEMVESYAARTLFESRQPALPSGFEAHLARAKEASDAS